MSETKLGRPSSSAAEQRTRFRIVTLVAAIVAVPFVAVHLWQVTWVPSVQRASVVLGYDPLSYTRILFPLARSGALQVVVVALDLAIFWLGHRLARRFWIGLLFAPVFAYLGVAAVYYLALIAPVLAAITLLK